MSIGARIGIELCKLVAASAAIPAGIALTNMTPALAAAGVVLFGLGLIGLIILAVSWIAVAFAAQFDDLMPQPPAPPPLQNDEASPYDPAPVGPEAQAASPEREPPSAFVMRQDVVLDLLDDVIRPIVDPDTFAKISDAALDWAEEARSG